MILLKLEQILFLNFTLITFLLLKFQIYLIYKTLILRMLNCKTSLQTKNKSLTNTKY